MWLLLDQTLSPRTTNSWLTLYPKVQESLKFLADEHVILEDPLSSTGTLLSIKNLEDAYAIGDQFINEKSTDDEPGKLNVEVEVVSMVTVPIYQASSSVPPLLTPVIDLLTPKPASSTTQAPIFTATITTTPTTLPPPPQQQSTPESKLAKHVTALEKKLSNLEQNNKNLGNMTQNLRSRVYNLELRDLPHKINEAVHENVKEAIQIALQAPLRERFRYLSEEDMKDMLHQKKISHSRTCLETILPHIPNSSAENNWANALASMYQAPAEKSLLEKTGDMRTFMNWYCQKVGKAELTQAYFEGQAYEVAKAFYPDVVHLHPSGYVTIQTQFFFNKDLDYLRYGSKGCRQALSISKMKAARYHDFGLKLLVPEHMYVGIKAYSRYGYDYLKEITLRRADYQEYTIAEKDFKNLYPSDFEDMNMLILQGEDLQLGIESYQKQLNLTKPGWDAMGYEYKHDYTIIESPCAVVFPVSNNERKIIRFNEVYKLSDGTLTNILEVMHYKVKEYKFNRFNPAYNYIELNDLNEPFKLRRNQGDDLMPIIEEGEYEEFEQRNDNHDAELILP
ncbi:hypothetical protein Tco_0569325 [Tanacetum coccineum]